MEMDGVWEFQGISYSALRAGTWLVNIVRVVLVADSKNKKAMTRCRWVYLGLGKSCKRTLDHHGPRKASASTCVDRSRIDCGDNTEVCPCNPQCSVDKLSPPTQQHTVCRPESWTLEQVSRYSIRLPSTCVV